jgi:thiol:disulfide interchange protein DsbA
MTSNFLDKSSPSPSFTLSRRHFNTFLLASLAGAALPASALVLVPERDYALIQPPQPGVAAGKIEVLEFFSYGCSHCKEFHPLVMAWAAKLPKDVSFKRVPVTFGRAAWASIARLYYALQATGDLARLDDAVFHAIHDERVNLYSEKSMLDWLQSKGVDSKRFSAAFNSFGINTQLARDEQSVKNYKVSGVPLLTVAGRYAVTGQAAKSLADLLPIASELVAMARKGKRS